MLLAAELMGRRTTWGTSREVCRWALACLTASALTALAEAAPVLTTRLPSAPVIDGDLGDPAWQAVPTLGALVQQLPDQGAAPSERTEARLGYDDRAVYFAVRLWDSQPAEIVA